MLANSSNLSESDNVDGVLQVPGMSVNCPKDYTSTSKRQDYTSPSFKSLMYFNLFKIKFIIHSGFSISLFFAQLYVIYFRFHSYFFIQCFNLNLQFMLSYISV